MPLDRGALAALSSFVLIATAFAAACSSDDGNSNSSSSSGGASSSGGTSSSGGGTSSSGSPSCSCNVSNNGVAKTLACGTQGCVNGTTYSCSSSADVSQGGSCTDTSNDGGGSSSGGCGLFTCSNSADCGGIAPCMSTSTGKNYCYEQEGNADQCSKGTTPTTAMVDGSSRTLCVPSSCPQPDKFLP